MHCARYQYKLEVKQLESSLLKKAGGPGGQQVDHDAVLPPCSKKANTIQSYLSKCGQEVQEYDPALLFGTCEVTPG